MIIIYQSTNLNSSHGHRIAERVCLMPRENRVSVDFGLRPTTKKLPIHARKA
jgi:hypothetical protein